MWQYTGKQRPPFAIEPKAGQQSVWDFPRPPSIEPVTRSMTIRSSSQLIAQSDHGWRICETAGAPTYYLPIDSVNMALLVPVRGGSFCEWKGRASYLALANRPNTPVAWYYSEPSPTYASIAEHLSFYPGRVDCFLDDELVAPQPSEFYGGWVTSDLVGPIKGEPGSEGW